MSVVFGYSLGSQNIKPFGNILELPHRLPFDFHPGVGTDPILRFIRSDADLGQDSAAGQHPTEGQRLGETVTRYRPAIAESTLENYDQRRKKLN